MWRLTGSRRKWMGICSHALKMRTSENVISEPISSNLSYYWMDHWPHALALSQMVRLGGVMCLCVSNLMLCSCFCASSSVWTCSPFFLMLYIFDLELFSMLLCACWLYECVCEFVLPSEMVGGWGVRWSEDKDQSNWWEVCTIPESSSGSCLQLLFLIRNSVQPWHTPGAHLVTWQHNTLFHLTLPFSALLVSPPKALSHLF